MTTYEYEDMMKDLFPGMTVEEVVLMLWNRTAFTNTDDIRKLLERYKANIAQNKDTCILCGDGVEKGLDCTCIYDYDDLDWYYE